jgi:hypothetical protein
LKLRLRIAVNTTLIIRRKSPDLNLLIQTH